MKMFDGREK